MSVPVVRVAITGRVTEQAVDHLSTARRGASRSRVRPTRTRDLRSTLLDDGDAAPTDDVTRPRLVTVGDG